MKALYAVIAASLLTNVAYAENWVDMLGELNRMKQTTSVLKRKAICCNNLAIEAHQLQRWVEAEDWIRKAVSYDRDGGYGRVAAKIFLDHAAHAYKQRANRNFAGYMHRQSKLLAERALTFDPQRADAYLFIGDIEYENQKLAAAEKAWKKAKAIEPQLSGLTERLSRIDREAKVEKKYKKTSNSFFDIRYQHRIDRESASALRFAITTARKNVGQDFAYRLKHRLNVIVYSGSDFQELRLGPHWAGGLYDGKIRLPLDGKQNIDVAVATLFHEYTHAVIHDLARGHCPRWLNEGLAEVQGRKIKQEPVRFLEKALMTKQIIPLEQLDYAFQVDDTRVVALGYEQSYSVASYLIERAKYSRIRKLLSELGKEVPFEIALRKTVNLSTTDLESAWMAWASADE